MLKTKSILSAVAILSIARVCHEAIRQWCLANGDDSIKPWEEAEQWQRESTIEQAERILNKPDVTDEEVHNNWAEERKEAGWIWGEVKDNAKKTNPCLVPYGELPEYQQKKDTLFRGIVNALA